MFRTTHTAPAQLFDGVGRPHRLMDVAAIALCLAFIGGFIAHAATPTSAVSHRALLAATEARATQFAR